MPYTEWGPEDEKKSPEQWQLDSLTDWDKKALPFPEAVQLSTKESTPEEDNVLGGELFENYMKTLTTSENIPEENHPMLDFFNNIDPNNLNIKEIYNKLQTNNLFSDVNINFLLPKSRTPDSNKMFFKVKSALDNKNLKDFSTAFEDIIPYIKDYINDMKPSSEKYVFYKNIVSSENNTYSDAIRFFTDLSNDWLVQVVSNSTPGGIGRDTKDLWEISTKSKEQILANQEENLIAPEKNNNTLSRVFFSKLFFTESGNKGSQMNILDSFSNNIFKNNKLVENIANMNKLYLSLWGNIDKFENITPIDLTNPENFINAIRTLKEQISEDQLTNLLIDIDSNRYNNDDSVKDLIKTIINNMNKENKYEKYAKNHTRIIDALTSWDINNLIKLFNNPNVLDSIDTWVKNKKEILLKDHNIQSEHNVAQN